MPSPRWLPLHILLGISFLPALAGTTIAQGTDYLKTHYIKYECRIPMRDGVRLFTAVYVPRDTTRRYPILLQRTPYGVGPYGRDRYPENLGPSFLFGKAGYIVAYQDVRGCYLSQGEFLDMRPHKAVKAGPQDTDESSDAYDTIDWLLKNVPGHNGRVGLWGISYPGFYAACAMLDAHPALKVVSPQAAPDRLVPRRRYPSQWGVLSSSRSSISMPSLAVRVPYPPPETRRTSTTAHATPTPFSSPWDRSTGPTCTTSRGSGPSGTTS